MNDYIINLLIGVVSGLICVVLMRKSGRNAMYATLVFYVVMAFVIPNFFFRPLPWWAQGGVLYGACALPMAVYMGGNDKRTPLLTVVTAIILGTLVVLFRHQFLSSYNWINFNL